MIGSMHQSSVEIKKCQRPMNATIVAPPSKAHTLRAIYIGALANGRTTIINPLLAQDQLAALEAVRKLGAKVRIGKGEISIDGGIERLRPEKVNAQGSGVSARFLLPICCLIGGQSIVDGSMKMRSRPIKPLVEALRRLGASIDYLKEKGHLPVRINGSGLDGGKCNIEASASSQFISALLVTGPLINKGIVLNIGKKIASRPYIEITREVMERFGAKTEKKENEIRVASCNYRPCRYRVEGDYSSAAFLFAAAAITNGSIRVKGLSANTRQGDKFFTEILEKMGCKIKIGRMSVKLIGARNLKAININMSDCPDIVMPLAAVCLFARGTSRIGGVETLRLKESDRVQAIIENIRNLGGKARFKDGKIHIKGAGIGGTGLHGGLIDPHNDHRIAMAFAVAGLRIGGIRICNPECVKKSFPAFFKVLRQIWNN
ncbi:3-phosphoshikimate 1-carboxyvinyltransferase [Candidatus Parvarchaeota archaeon]|nr:3-phosphoshikimate 1-carboxyvinyltransferase [Candidatus Parvarchaeota archaeon]